MLTDAQCRNATCPHDKSRARFTDAGERLTAGRGTVPHLSKKSDAIEGKGGQKGQISFSEKKRNVRIELQNIDPKRFDEVRIAIKKLLA